MLARTLKIQFHPQPQAKQKVDGMLRAARDRYNELVGVLAAKRQRYQELRDITCRPWDIDAFTDIRKKGWAWDVLRTFANAECSVWPMQMGERAIKQGKKKGYRYSVVARKKTRKPQYGMPAQSAGAIARNFEAAIASFFTHTKNGNVDAELPRRFKSYYPVPFTNQHVAREGDAILLGAGDYKIRLKIPELRGVDLSRGVQISKSRSGKYYLHVVTKREVEAQDLPNVAAADLGQKRAIVLAVANGDGTAETVQISGKDICGLKRERDRRYRGINRKRNRVFRGQLRQYLSEAEKATYRRLQEEDNERQRQGKKRTGNDAKYAWRMIRQRRQEGVDGKGRSLVAIGQLQDGKTLRRRSKRDWKLLHAQHKAGDYYTVRLRYANHCVTRAAADWCVKRGVGKVYVGDLASLPKGRKKGNRRVKQVARNNQWEWPTQEKYLGEKLQEAGGAGTERHTEAFTSQTCPKCGARHKPRGRVYRCRSCGWQGDRDGVGAANFLSLVTTGACGKLLPAPPRTLLISSAKRCSIPKYFGITERTKSKNFAAIPSSGRSLPLSGPANLAIGRELAEASAKSAPSNGQAPPTVAGAERAKTNQNPLSEGETPAREGLGVLAKRFAPGPSVFPTPVGDAQQLETREPSKPRRRSLQRQSESYTQLTIWDSVCDSA